MKARKSLEQVACILLMLGLSQKQEPVKSYIISQRLEVSDSYLKKLLRHLVLEGLVTSESGKDGGFVLVRPLHEISILDVFYAVEGRESFVSETGIAYKVFKKKEVIDEQRSAVLDFFREAEQLYFNKLAEYTMLDLLPADLKDDPCVVDWPNLHFDSLQPLI